MRNKKKKKQNGYRKFYLLILVLLSGIMLSTTTYAWFTVNRIVSINSLNVRVESQGGIEISADGTNWKSRLENDDLKNAINTYPTNVNQLPSKMEPVSTGGETIDGRLNMYYGLASNNSDGYYVLTTEKQTDILGGQGKYMAFDLFLKTNQESMIYLTRDSGANYVGEKYTGIENAIRFAFLNEGNVNTGSSLGTIQALKNASTSDVYIWEPNYNTHSLTGISNAYDTYGIVIGNNSNKLDYDGVIGEINNNENILLGKANSTLYPNYFKQVDVDIATVNGFNNNQELLKLKSGITKIRVYIWLEGQDVDCENNAAVGNIEFKFQFSTNPN